MHIHNCAQKKQTGAMEMQEVMAALWIVGVGVVFLIAMLGCLRLAVREFRARVYWTKVCKFASGIDASDDPDGSWFFRSRRKPDWVIREVLKLKAYMPKAGCRKVAQAFNQRHSHRVTVGKSFVADCLKKHQYDLLELQRKMKNKKPWPTRVNANWAMDLTFHADERGIQQTVLGIIDHGSRMLLRLQTVANKKSWTLLGHVCLAIGRYDKPKAIRTDNEAVFTSRLFKLFLAMAGIKHQRTQLHSPWQNGRIERLFGTLKPLLRQLTIASHAVLQVALDEFTLFYNHVRTHQNLDGRTPAQAWNKVTWTDLKQNPPKEVTLVQALDGLCVGYHIGVDEQPKKIGKPIDSTAKKKTCELRKSGLSTRDREATRFSGKSCLKKEQRA
jgi:putative transposase